MRSALAIGHEFLNRKERKANGFYIGIGKLSEQCRLRGFAVRGAHAPFKFGIFSILIIIVFVGLSGVVGWIGNHHADRRSFLTVNAFRILRVESDSHVLLLMLFTV